MKLHWLAEKMIDEFDPKKGHVHFPLPFIRTIQSTYGWPASLRWVSSTLKPYVQISDSTRQAFRLTNAAIESAVIDDLAKLDKQAWALWIANPELGDLRQRSLANFTWAVMAYICICHDYDYSCTSSAVNFSSENYTREQSLEQCASSAMSLATNRELSRNEKLQCRIATDFSREIDRLRGVAG